MANVPTDTDENGKPVAAIPLRIVATTTAADETGRYVDALPIRIVAGKIDILTGKPVSVPPIVQLATTTTTSETGATIAVQPARIVAALTTTDSAGRTVDVVPVRDIGATVTLNTLTLSGSLQIGVATSGAISGATVGSTITANIPGITVNSGARTYSGTPTGSAATIANGLVETLAGATNSPNSSPVTVAAGVFSFADNFNSGANGDTVARRPGWTVRSDDSRLYLSVQSQGIVQSDGFSPAANPFAGVDLGRVDGGYVQATFLAQSFGKGIGFYYDKDNWIQLSFLSSTRLIISERVGGTTTTRFDTGVNMSAVMAASDVFKLILTYSGTAPRLTIQRNGVNFPQQSDYASGIAPTFPLTSLTLSLPLGLAGFISAIGSSTSVPNWDNFSAGHSGATPLPRLSMAKSVRVYQRNKDTGTRSIPIGGDASGVTGVEMRLLQNGSVVSGWDWGQKPLTNVSIAGGAWFADTAQVPGGDFYIAEARATNDNSALCRTRVFAVDDIFIAGGQSNGTGLATAAPAAGGTIVGPAGGYAVGGPLASSVGGNDVGAYRYPADVQFDAPPQSSMTGSAAAALQAGLRAGAPDGATMTVPFGLGSSNLARFMPSSTDHTAVVGTMSLWEGLMSQLVALNDPTGRDTTTVDFAGVIFAQGEEDAGRALATASFNAAAESAYRANMVSYYGSLKTATGRTAAQLPFVIVPLNRVYTTTSASQAASPSWTRFRAMQWDMCDPASAGYIPGFFYAGSIMDIPLQDTGTAQVHYGTGAYERSHRAGYAMARAKGWATKDRRGAIPLSAVAVGNTIVVTFDLQLATSLTCAAAVSSQYLFATSNAVDSTTLLLTAANQVVPTAMVIGTPSGGQCTVTYTFAGTPAAGWAVQFYGGVNPQNVVGKDTNALYSVMPTDAGAGANVLSAGAFYPLVVTA